MRLFRIGGILVLLSLAAVLISCSPKVGSEEWCKDMEKKPKKDWTAAEAADYTKYCVLKMKPE